jgi:hypothetical protein
LTERTSLPLCSFQGSRRRTGTSAGTVGRARELADRPAESEEDLRAGGDLVLQN